MNTIADYQIVSKIYESSNSLVYRAVPNFSDRSVILKILKEDYPIPSELTRYKQEYEITRSLQIDGAIKAYNLLPYESTLAIVLEDFGGESVDILMKSKTFSLLEFLSIAIQIAETLGEIHAANVIHKDINPSNIVLNPKTGQVKIIDFGISTIFRRENPTLKHPNLLEGTLAYLSPEQTGRMNRAIDYSTDFYSLGATFYKILTQRLPFETNDALELVHCHIAKQPVPPHEINPDIPRTVSNIVMKLLAKTSEERYQSTLGLKADLEECLTQLQQTGQISEFPLARHDISDQFKIPQKLYGREAEIETLLSVFQRVAEPNLQQKKAEDRANRKRTEMMLVGGYSGIGKSVLVQELYKPITQQRGYFISGKFDQFKRNIPYSAVVFALQSLVRQLLSESEDQLTQWREKLLIAFGVNGQVIIDVIPEVEQIVGPQPPVQPLEPTEAQNRFNGVFQKFIRVFCQRSHPLVLFLDDLQWADSASLRLIELMMTDDGIEALLLLGAYRDNEVSSTHPTMLTVERLKKQGAIINTIILTPLKLEEIAQLIADTLYSNQETVKPLAQLVSQKTSGNPFFINEFLRTIYQENLLTFNRQQKCWQWDITHIDSLGITENVVDLMLGKLRKLSETTQKPLRLAACVGNRFDLNTLSIINEKSALETFKELLPAIQLGVIQPNSELETTSDTPIESALIIKNYKFQHDRVQQAAYALIPESSKKAIHLKIGQLLLERTNENEKEENIFEIVNHLNNGVDLLASQSEKEKLAQLDLMAARKAKAATAYEPATRYLTVALELLEANSWQNHYELTFSIYLEAVETEYLNTNFVRSAVLAEVVLQHATSLLDRVKVYEVQIQFYMAQNQMSKAIDTALASLNQMGISLLSIPSDRNALPVLPPLEELDNLPAIADPYQLAALRVLMSVASPAYITKPEIFPRVILTLVNLCNQKGYSALAAYIYAQYGLVLCAVLNDIDTGYLSGQLALKLLDRFNVQELKCKVYDLFNVFVRPWKEHLRETMSSLIEGIKSGLETGDIEYVGYSTSAYCSNIFLMGEPLEIVAQQQGKYLDLLLSLKLEYPIKYIQIWKQLTLKFIEESTDNFYLKSNFFNEFESLPVFIESHNKILLFNTYLAKTILLYLFKDYESALVNADRAAEYAESVLGWNTFAIHNFYYSLTLLGRCPQFKISDRKKYLKKVEKNQLKMQRWANHAPENYLHKYELIEAEKFRILGQTVEAMEYYDRAIEDARKQGYIQEQALASELAAEFYLSLGRENIARLYMTQSYHGYTSWGATAKVRDLESRYPQLLSPISPATRNVKLINSTTDSITDGNAEVLDLITIVKASQALAGEIILDKLLDKLLNIVMENAGATASSLILEKDGQLLIQATGVVEPYEIVLWPSKPIATIETCNSKPLLPLSVINYVARTQENVVLNDAVHEGIFTRDPYIIECQPKSILGMPIVNQGKLIGILYLENNLVTGAFTPEHLEVLKLLSSQAAISLQNAQLYVALRESERKLAQFLEAVPVGVFVTDATGKPYYANQTAQQILGKEIVTEATAAQLPEIYQAYQTGTNQLYPAEQQPILRALNGESITVDDMAIDQGDRVIPLEVSATPILDQKGQIVYAIAAFQDITQRKQAELERFQFTRELAFKNIALAQAKDALAESNRTLEQKVIERTQELSQTLDVLKATQAKLEFENALLRSAEEPSIYDYQVGGSLPIHSPTYVVRAADRYLYKALKLGEFCYILNARQMGKSSLMVRMLHYLQQEGLNCVAIDMTRIGSENITPEQWYKGLAVELWQSFNLFGKVNLKAWWNERSDLSPVHRLSRFIEEVLLIEVGIEENAPPQKLVIFLDEIDSVLGLNFSVNDFFALIRSCYNQRSLNPAYQRLTFALFGVATPSDLITDTQRTPFNIGQAIQLNGFQVHEAQPLLHGLSEKVSNPQVVLKEVLAWTKGQPFLTQKICKLIRTSPSGIPTNREAEWVENLVRSRVIENWESQDEPEHLRTIRDRLLNSQLETHKLLELYREILRQRKIVAVDSPEERELLLSGVIVKQQSFLAVHSPIYESIFNSRWVESHL